MAEAVGFIETFGLTAAIEAADAAVKSADVRMIGYELTKGGGMVTVKFGGDVGAVKSAIDAAKASAAKVSGVFSVNVIPRPAEATEMVIRTFETIPHKSGREPAPQENSVLESSSSPDTALPTSKFSEAEYITDSETLKTEAGNGIEEQDAAEEPDFSLIVEDDVSLDVSENPEVNDTPNPEGYPTPNTEYNGTPGTQAVAHKTRATNRKKRKG
jgi:microcompartment protein CcmL/EutN